MKVWLLTKSTNVGVLRDHLREMGVTIGGFDHADRAFVHCELPVPCGRPSPFSVAWGKGDFMVTADDVNGVIVEADSLLLYAREQYFQECPPELIEKRVLRAMPPAAIDVVGPQP